jgi:tRNA pseudouridine65 synthase
MAAAFRERRVRKTYFAVVRGWTEDAGEIARELRNEIDEPLPSLTLYRTIARLELPHAVGPYPTARYSLVRAQPMTGRMHQIRRHFAGISHPLVGDTIYGDGAHNRFFRETLAWPGLALRAHALELPSTDTAPALRIEAWWRGPWLRLFDLFGACPWGSGE